ncbi:MAG: SlyX family protein [Pirellulales bacterium]
MSDPKADARELECRLSEMESVLMFLQRTTDDLNTVILEQQRRLEAQDNELARLRAMFANFADAMPEAPRKPEDETPPHY